MQATRHPRTAEKARNCLRPFLEYCRRQGIDAPEQFTRSHWLYFLREVRQSHYSAWTQHNIGKITRQFLRWCVAEGLLETSPDRQGDLPRKPEPQPNPLTVAQVQRLLERLKGDHWLQRRNYALALCLLDTGLRRAELLQMTVQDALSGVVRVRQKGSRFHTAYLSPEVQAEVRRYLRGYTRATGQTLQPDELLWRARDGKPLGASGTRRIFSMLAPALGERVYPHRLRATSITLRLALGASTELVREAVGHSDERSLRHYAKLAEADRARLLRETSPLQALKRRR
ncbi:MAG: tyrosine-type recombinase/integrase [Fimbriimonadales bacterium]|nr:tyrosine-type recombinase/integrase [Fimbriimonadales bacterium]